MQGLVLAVQRGNGRAIVHEGVGPQELTATFAIAPPAMARRLHAGDMIEAQLDRTTKPPTLSAIRMLGAESLTNIPASSQQPKSALRDVTPLVVGNQVPQTPFIDEHGRPFTFASLRGEPVVLAFIYTRCTDECPLISAKFHRIQTLLAGTTTQLVEVSLDPNFDTPGVLTRYAHTFGADLTHWTFLTGNLDRILDFAARFDVSAIADPRYGIIHSQRTVIIDRYGVITQFIDDSSWTPDEVVAAVRNVEHESSNPIARFNLWLSAQAAAICGDSSGGFSGLVDLIATALILTACCWLLYRIGRHIFAAER